MGPITRIACLLCLLGSITAAQMQKDYLIHKRGMLHQTVYNTGELGRKYGTSNANTEPGIPSFEWPGNSATVVDGKQYTGQHNSYGGGVQIAADRVDSAQRLYAFCGGMIDAVAEYINSFPLSQERIENFPVLANGSLNSAYNPNEAEEKIISKWATPVGVTITRTSRAWSFPDYDDFIIYEYEFENTGDLDGNLTTAAKPVRLKDLIINFDHGITGGKFGYDRTSESWSPSVVEKKDYYARFDPKRWLQYGLHRTGNPEPKYFAEWAATGENGGGLISPQATGYMVLYYDTLHLVIKGDGTRTNLTGSDTVSWDSHGHVKQPYYMRLETSQMTSYGKLVPYILDITQNRKLGPITNANTFGADWVGRGSFNWRQSTYFAIGRNIAFGPYNLNPGEKVCITIAEVGGYGAARLEETLAGVKDIGGSNGQSSPPTAEAGDSLYAFYTVPNYWIPNTQKELNPNSVNTVVFGSDYLSNFSLPDYVNSNVVTVREVADRAIQAYTNEMLVNHNSVQYWPEKYQEHGIYAIPIPVPAPSIKLEDTVLGEHRIVWGAQVESFATPRLQGIFDHYEVYKASQPLGPWTKLAAVSRRDPQYFSDGNYQLVDKNSRTGDYLYYSVLSVDNKGNKSGRTNITRSMTAATEVNESPLFGVPTSFQVGQNFPNPFNPSTTISYSLPKASRITLRVFNTLGQEITTLVDDHKVAGYHQVRWDAANVPSGIYFCRLQAGEFVETKKMILVR